MPSFFTTVKKSLLDSYDRLGMVVATSLLWFGTVLGIAWLVVYITRSNLILRFIALVGAYVVVVAPLTTGVFYISRKIVSHDDPSFFDLFGSISTFVLQACKLGLLQVLISITILFNMWFYLTRRTVILNILGVLFIYAMLLWVLTCVYHYPLMVEQRPGGLKTIKRSFLLTIDNIAFTAGTFFVIILLTCLYIVIPFGFPLLFAGTVSILQTRVLRALFVKYGILEPEKEFTAEEESVLPPILLEDSLEKSNLESKGTESDG
jgi:uncharacterized membrane protein YesL